MDKKEISRRETLNLAKFGLLLAAGLGVVEESTAKSDLGATTSKYDPGALYVKFFKSDGNNLTLVKTMELPAVQYKLVQADNASQVMLKFWRPAGVGKSEAVYGSLTDSIIKTI